MQLYARPRHPTFVVVESQRSYVSQANKEDKYTAKVPLHNSSTVGAYEPNNGKLAGLVLMAGD